MRMIIGIAAGLVFAGFLFIEGLIGFGVLKDSQKAVGQFGGNRIEALISLVNCETCNLADRNSAVWTLGQLRDKRALPTLYKYRSGKSCNHRTEICQKEITKAIKWIEGNAYMLPPVWRIMLWKDYLVSA